jgi:hypothetical protein
LRRLTRFFVYTASPFQTGDFEFAASLYYVTCQKLDDLRSTEARRD